MTVVEQRYRAVLAVGRAEPKALVAAAFGVSRQTLHTGCAATRPTAATVELQPAAVAVAHVDRPVAPRTRLFGLGRWAGWWAQDEWVWINEQAARSASAGGARKDQARRPRAVTGSVQAGGWVPNSETSLAGGLQLSTRRERDGLVVVVLAGEVDLRNCAELEMVVAQEAAAPGVERVVVDLTEVGFLAVCGVRCLSRAQAKIRQNAASMLVAVSPQAKSLRRELELLGDFVLHEAVPAGLSRMG
ncbi:STAS domain-containing protein [Pseudonocardia kujensis]|uniref:STAS domain-containing protein n=1 Tax=Pseudonocardia kujensis TaxID=1128675 RepID=UPI001E3BDC2F|nr:STAS domain-containing protein [Pseudonocardia kujensis]MCE0767638.1 STAS domain-containing protein [Pseudonocardia kujensis]